MHLVYLKQVHDFVLPHYRGADKLFQINSVEAFPVDEGVGVAVDGVRQGG
jgi:hypothetical protein